MIELLKESGSYVVMSQEQLEKEFMASFASYGDAIFRFALVKVSNPDIAEDIVQETFMRYWQSHRAGKSMTNTRSLLYTIANNLAKDWYKKKKAESLDARIEAGHEPEGSEAPDPERHAAYHEVLRAIEALGPDDKEILYLRWIDGLEPKDIAEILGETPNVISVRLNRAGKRLGKELGETP